MVVFSYLNPDPALRRRPLPARRRRARRGGRAADRPPGGQRSRRRVGHPDEPARSHPAGRADDPSRRGSPPSVEGAQGFVYLVARLGVTGATASLADGLAESIARVRAGDAAAGRRRVRDLHAGAGRARWPGWPTASWSAARWWTSLGTRGRGGGGGLPAARCARRSTRGRWLDEGPHPAAGGPLRPGAVGWAACSSRSPRCGGHALDRPARRHARPDRGGGLLRARAGPPQQVLLPHPDRRGGARGRGDRRARRRWCWRSGSASSRPTCSGSASSRGPGSSTPAARSSASPRPSGTTPRCCALAGHPGCRSTSCRPPPSWSACTSSRRGRSSTSPCWSATSWSTPRRS